ncbi:hypothetical protein BGW80DRAFT_734498 [Lactifluus volemus]|nr:hypothetical protein BGW80DRAFT_734498 [Lactifluus volemus]
MHTRNLQPSKAAGEATSHNSAARVQIGLALTPLLILRPRSPSESYFRSHSLRDQAFRTHSKEKKESIVTNFTHTHVLDTSFLVFVCLCHGAIARCAVNEEGSTSLPLTGLPVAHGSASQIACIKRCNKRGIPLPPLVRRRSMWLRDADQDRTPTRK